MTYHRLLLTSGRAYTKDPNAGNALDSPAETVVKYSSNEVVFIVSCMWILVSGAFGSGKESSIGAIVESAESCIVSAMTFLYMIVKMNNSATMSLE